MKKFVLFFIIFSILIIGIKAQYLSFTSGISLNEEQETQPELNFVDGATEYAEITYRFKGLNIQTQKQDNTEYQIFKIDGFTTTKQVGAPSLPARNDLLALPSGSQAQITLVKTNYFEYDGFSIHPTLEPARDTEGAPEPEFWKDPAVYEKDAFFPQDVVAVTDLLHSRETPLAVVQVRPVQYNPVTGRIRVYTEIEYRIDYIRGMDSYSNIGEQNSETYTRLLKRNVLNSKNIPDGLSSFSENTKAGAKNYIIITHSEYLSQANQLANWKRQMGYTVEVVDQASWTAAQVKTEIHNRYNDWTPKPDYFVILGDHNGSYAVPGEIHYTSDNPPEPFATDLYFACMGGSGDWVPDMAHGRISVSSASEAQIIINKIIDYEKDPVNDAGFYQNVLNCAQYQDDDNNGYADRRFCHTSEDIRDYLQDEYGYTSERIYYSSTSANVTSLRYENGYYSTGGLLPSELRTTSFDWNGGHTDITNAINEGKFLVFHRDHGYTGGSGWAHPYYTTTTMSNLSNGDLLPVVFSINCHTGEFQLSNCFAEKFLRMENKGAVGVVGAAYYSYSGYNDALSIGMIDAIWPDPGLYGI